jgi:hypothetical protein
VPLNFALYAMQGPGKEMQLLGVTSDPNDYYWSSSWWKREVFRPLYFLPEQIKNQPSSHLCWLDISCFPAGSVPNGPVALLGFHKIFAQLIWRWSRNIYSYLLTWHILRHFHWKKNLQSSNSLNSLRARSSILARFRTIHPAQPILQRPQIHMTANRASIRTIREGFAIEAEISIFQSDCGS